MTDFFAVLLCRLTAWISSFVLVLSGFVPGYNPPAPTETEAAPVIQTDYISDPQIWATPSMTSDGRFCLEIENSSVGERDHEKARSSVAAYGMGVCECMRASVRAEEWGYSALHLPTGTVDGAGRVMENCLIGSDPADRAEALGLARQFVMNQYVRGSEHPWSSMNGHYSWHHYAGEWGFDILGSEIGENIHGYQFHIAMNRGAARQYGTPWFIDFSMWHADGILDYSEQHIWGDMSGTKNGHSVNLMERSFVASYMSGADSVNAEAGIALSFLSETDGETGFYKLSPYGEVCRRLNSFAQEYPDTGVTFTPIGIVLDYYHGMDNNPKGNRSFGKFEYSKGDTMTNRLVEMLWNDTWSVSANGNEKGALTNNAYGDSVDFLLQNAPQDILGTYPALVLSGDITLSPEEAERFKEYVKQGGILVLNTAYLGQFPEYADSGYHEKYEISDGDGRVIVYGPDYSVRRLGGIISDLLKEFVPFIFPTEIQRIVNVKDGYIYLTLINNDGVTKTPHRDARVNPLMKKDLTVVYTGQSSVSGIRDIYNGIAVKTKGNIATLELEPGGIAVLEYSFE